MKMGERKRRSLAMKRQWMDPEFRRRASEAARQSALKRWRDPAFVDRFMQRVVSNWQKEDYRRLQIARIRAGQRTAPLSGTHRGYDCPLGCARTDFHAFHVAVEGNLEEGTLGLRGWVDVTAIPTRAAEPHTSYVVGV